MDKLQNKEEIRIVLLFLEKLESLTQREREVLIKTIDMLNHPLFVSGSKLN